jgi:hypothetical protein
MYNMDIGEVCRKHRIASCNDLEELREIVIEVQEYLGVVNLVEHYVGDRRDAVMFARGLDIYCSSNVVVAVGDTVVWPEERWFEKLVDHV